MSQQTLDGLSAEQNLRASRLMRIPLPVEHAAIGMEWLADGQYQHLRRKHGIDSVQWRAGYSWSRTIREFIRSVNGDKQWTITTGSKQFNTKPYFYLNADPVTVCCRPIKAKVEVTAQKSPERPD